MKRLWKIAVVLAGGLAWNAGFCAPNPAAMHLPPPKGPAPDNAPLNNPSPDNPYMAIASRNIFGLNPPVAETKVVNPADNLPKITPTGINGVFGHYQVLFKVAPAKPAPAEKDQYYILSEGQRQDDIEVVKIDDEKSLVTFDNHGTQQELPLAEAPAAGGAPPASQGGMNPAMPPGAPVGRGNGGPGGFTTFGAGPGTPSSGPATGWPSSNGQPGNPANSGLNFGGSTEGRIYQPEASTMTPEESQIILTANKYNAFIKHDPTAPLFPPSALDHEAGIPSNTGTDTAPPTP